TLSASTGSFPSLSSALSCSLFLSFTNANLLAGGLRHDPQNLFLCFRSCRSRRRTSCRRSAFRVAFLALLALPCATACWHPQLRDSGSRHLRAFGESPGGLAPHR